MTEMSIQIEDEQRRIVELVRPFDVSAPESLHRQVESLVATYQERHVVRRASRRVFSPVALASAGAVLVAVVAVVIAVGLSGGGSVPTVSFSQAAAPTLRAATLPAPPESQAHHAQLAAVVDGVPFPYWSERFGRRSTGARADRVDGRSITTVFYSDSSGRRIGYAILAGTTVPRVGGGVIVGVMAARRIEATPVSGKVRGVAVSIGRDEVTRPSTPTFRGTMKRTYVFLAVALVSAASAATVASAQRNLLAAHSSRAATVQLRHTNLGSILVSSSGRTLYEFTRDHANKSSCATIRGCSEVWLSLKASGRPKAGSGIKASLLSSTSGKQVTYAGHPLYTYSGDSGPGKTSYVGVKQFGGTWYAINASGGTVK